MRKSQLLKPATNLGDSVAGLDSEGEVVKQPERDGSNRVPLLPPTEEPLGQRGERPAHSKVAGEAGEGSDVLNTKDHESAGRRSAAPIG
jgi:hypothetical protein